MKRNHEVLEDAISLLKRGWTQHTMARDKNELPVPLTNRDACQWCLVGALAKAGGAADYKTDDQHRSILNQLRAMTGEDYVSTWNDIEFRTQADVLALLNKALEQEKSI